MIVDHFVYTIIADVNIQYRYRLKPKKLNVEWDGGRINIVPVLCLSTADMRRLTEVIMAMFWHQRKAMSSATLIPARLWLYSIILIITQNVHRKTKITTLRPEQNSRHFADNISKGIFLNEKFRISNFAFKIRWSLFLRVQLISQ